MAPQDDRADRPRIWTYVIVSAAVVAVALLAYGYKQIVIGDTAGLARLTTDPILTPAPGSTELGRSERARRPAIGFDSGGGYVHVVSASRRAPDEVRDYYARSFPWLRRGALGDLSASLNRGYHVHVDPGQPPSARSMKLREAPPGTRSYVTVVVSQRQPG